MATPVDASGRVARLAGVEHVASEGECLLYSEARDEASALNRSATEIWDLCDGTRSIAAIARALGDRYGVDGSLLLGDVAAAITALQARGLVASSEAFEREPTRDTASEAGGCGGDASADTS